MGDGIVLSHPLVKSAEENPLLIAVIRNDSDGIVDDLSRGWYLTWSMGDSIVLSNPCEKRWREPTAAPQLQV